MVSVLELCRSGDLESLKSVVIDKGKLSFIFSLCCNLGHLHLVEYLYAKYDVNILMGAGTLFIMCSAAGRLYIMKWLLETVISEGRNFDVMKNNHQAVKISIIHEKFATTEWLLSLYDNYYDLVASLEYDICTIPIYKKGDVVIILGEIIMSGGVPKKVSMEMYLKDTNHLRKFVKKAE